MKRVVVPAREARAFMVTAGQTVTVVDVEGQQVADLFCFCADDPREYLSAEHTRVALGRLFPQVGQQFETNRRRAILTLVADDSPGVHDMLCAACTPERYRLLGADGWHASCEENLHTAMADIGISEIEVPQPVNLFESNPIGADGSLGIEPAPSQAGDSVTLRAEIDCIVCVTACPQDLTPLCGWAPTAVAVEIADDEAEPESGVTRAPKRRLH
ncbi:MAG: urea carboxylase-associated family protein [Thermoleophilia bacterium]|nr:urea carboxylase-associated family protein [Thermoleophilia bacterium]